MNHLTVHRGNREDADALVRKGVASGEWTPNVSSPVTVHDADTDEPLMVVAHYDGDLASLRRSAMAYPMNTTLRSAGIRNRSNVFGYTSRKVMMQRNGCRLCHGATDAPDAHEGIIQAGAVMAEMLAGILPEKAAADRETAASAIRDDWIIPGSPWTSGVLNLTSPLPYHYDRNNLATWSAMVVLRRGVRGGHLHVPELDLVVGCRDGDVVFFPGWHFVHGVTPLRPVEPDGYRYSAVFYTVAQMAHCLEPEEEMARARRDRSNREDDLIERQVQSGLRVQ